MQFRLDPHRCPECDSIAQRIVQTVGGMSRIVVAVDGTWEDAGDGCKIEWDTMHPHEDEEGRVRVYCENGHSWDANELITGADTEPTLQEKGDDIYEAVRPQPTESLEGELASALQMACNFYAEGLDESDATEMHVYGEMRRALERYYRPEGGAS